MKRPRSLRRYTIRPAGDGTLTALAQLAAFRVNYERTVISIFHGDDQYVVARATRHTLPAGGQGVSPVEQHEQPGHDPAQKYCAQAMRFFRARKADINSTVNDTAMIVTDKDSNPETRVFCVPIKTEVGAVGVLCAMDTRGHVIDTEHVPKMAEVADLIMQHLEMVCVVEDHQRAEKLLTGISQFLQGKNSLGSHQGAEDVAVSPSDAQTAGSQKGDSSDIEPPSDSTAHHVQSVFSRASNLIRECMDLDATCFLEVPGNERYKSAKRPKRAPGDPIGESESSTISDHDLDDLDGEPAADQSCQRLGYSTPGKSSLLASPATTQFLSMPARLLNILQSKYPRGRIFHFDHHATSSSEDDKLKLARPSITNELIKLYPNARSMIFYPLYDNERQHIYAGFIGWTVNPLRTLQKHEVIYVSGFANSIMCEVMRLESLAMDKAKSNFISSISHELRSPLHGILAANQLNEDNEYVQMVDICGRTLLDTMDQLLDYAKINSFKQRKSKKRTHSLVTNIHLATLIEETVISLTAGQQRTVPNEPIKTCDVPVFVNLKCSDVWVFRSEAGSWRRIILNVVGNALKYTQTGYVLVEAWIKRGKQFVGHVKVTDTGQGISEEYLKHRLYTPFAQEDNHSIGAGLGLSIINQIVGSMRGQMEVSSKVGTGTQISVQIPLEPSLDSSAPEFESLPKLTFGMFGFDRAANTNPESSIVVAERSIKNTLEEWLHMTPATDPDIFVVESSFLHHNLSRFKTTDKKLLVIRLDTSHSLDLTAPQIVLASPFGPQRLSKAIAQLLTKREPEPHTKPAPTTPDAASERVGTETQLLVDDNDINLRLMVACARGRPLTATNGLEAVEKYTSATLSGVRVTPVLLDISMPVMDGFEAARRIRAFEAENNVKPARIVAITGLASEEAQTKIEECGFDLYLRKPVSVKTVKKLLREDETEAVSG